MENHPNTQGHDNAGEREGGNVARETGEGTASSASGASRKAEWREARQPAVDIVSGENEVCLIMDIPGVREGGADVSVEKNVLTVRAAPASRNYHGRRLIYAECGEGEYRRSFSLPEDVDRDGISASLKDGSLRIRLPKVRPAAKRIAVSAG